MSCVDAKLRVLGWAIAAACGGSAIAGNAIAADVIATDVVATDVVATDVGADDVVVCRVGSGAGPLSSAAASVYLERRASDGTLVQTIALPTAVNGTNRRITLGGTNKGEGALAVSSDGKYLTVAGYDAAPGTSFVATTQTSAVNRIVARIDAAGSVDTTTRLNSAFDTFGIGGAVSVDGSAFWVSGNGTASLGGAWYLTLGTTGGTQILASPSNTRTLNIASGQLFGTTSTATYTAVFAVGTGLPTATGQSSSLLYGLPASQPYGFAFFDRTGTHGGLDTLYIADDRSIVSGGGIQKWTFDGSIWYLVTTFTDKLGTAGVRGLAAEARGANVVLYATTVEATGNKLVRVIDDGSASPATTVIATAAANTVYRGVALAWVAPAADVIFKDAFE